MTSQSQARLIVGPDAPAVRRSLGPLAWACLEAIVASAHASGGQLVATLSVRSLAEELALSKNTAARAIAVLRSAGLVASAQPRSRHGIFQRGHYVLAVPADVLAFAPRRHVSNGRSTVPSGTVEQLALLPS